MDGRDSMHRRSRVLRLGESYTWAQLERRHHIERGHELIERGPYRLVRHPIYTGMMAMILATAITFRHLGGLVAVILAFASFWIKLGEEEKLMLRQFPDQYGSYQQRVKRIIPFVF